MKDVSVNGAWIIDNALVYLNDDGRTDLAAPSAFTDHQLYELERRARTAGNTSVAGWAGDELTHRHAKGWAA